MKRWRLIQSSLWHYRRTQAGVLLGALVTAAALSGALLVGDSVRATLAYFAHARLGQTHYLLTAGERFFTADLAQKLQAQLPDTALPPAPVLLLPAAASRPDGQARANSVQVLGVDGRFAAFSPDQPPPLPGAEQVVLSAVLATQLQVATGDRILLRVPRPSALPRDMPLATEDDSVAALRVTVQAIIGDEQFARFGLQATQTPPLNAFVDRQWLGERLGIPGRANLVLFDGQTNEPEYAAAELNDAVQKVWTLDDAQLEVRPLPDGQLELRTARVFLDDPITAQLAAAQPHARRLLSYFVNELRVGDRATPYSVVCADSAQQDLRDDQIVLTDWLAHDLQAKVGDALTLRYYVLGPNRQLIEQAAPFTVARIIPLADVSDPTLMPEYPGLAQHDNCRDWNPGIPIDLDRIRPVDEQYWDDHRGTPKAYLTLAAGQKLWANRFGNLTAVRVATSMPAVVWADSLRAKLNPTLLGMNIIDVHTPAARASGDALDFGQLFLGLSFFLIVAALLLTGLLFALGAQERATETGLLLALGFTPRQRLRLLLCEGLLLALLGGGLGCAAGVGYTRLLLAGLSGVWSDAVAGSAVRFHLQSSSLVIALISTLLTALLAMWLSTRKLVRTNPAALLAGATSATEQLAKPRRGGLLIAGLCLIGAAGLAVSSSDPRQAAGLFFGSGALLLIAGLAACHALLTTGPTAAALTRARLAWRGAARRRGRSLAVIAMLACGCFLVTAVGVNRKTPQDDPRHRDTGTGGFALYAQSALPVLPDLNSAAGRLAAGLDESKLTGVSFVPMRVQEGDDASCLNLNRAQRPRLLGVKAEGLQMRHAFRFTAGLAEDFAEQRWRVLTPPGKRNATDPIPGGPIPGDPIPGVGDAAMVQWALGKKLGDTLTYQDERGQLFHVQIVAVLDSSILQGALLIDEAAFEQRFPSSSGYRVFLIDAPRDHAPQVASTLSQALGDVGLSVTPAGTRLAQFMAVENTYLAIFQLLGGLGLLLGSAGLAVVVGRNVLERRGELALLLAVGWRRGQLRQLLATEHILLLLAGLLIGQLAAIAAVWPAVQHSPNAAALQLTAVLSLALLALGILWVFLAAALALRGPLLASLREE